MTQPNGIDKPKSGTKEAKLVSALSGNGKTIKQLTALLTWQPHTVRAALTRLRQRGYTIERIGAVSLMRTRLQQRGLESL